MVEGLLGLMLVILLTSFSDVLPVTEGITGSRFRTDISSYLGIGRLLVVYIFNSRLQ